MLRVCCHYRWLHSYVLLVCRQHCRHVFVRVAEPRWYTPLSYIRTRCTSAAITTGYIRMCCSSAVNIVDLHPYALDNLVGMHCCPAFVRAGPMPSTSSTWVRTRCRASLVPTAVLHLYALLVCRQHHRPAFAHVAELRWYPLLSYIRMRCSYAINTTDLRSYALQNLVGTHHCPTFAPAAHLPPLPLATFIRTARLLSTSLTCVRMHCKTSSVRTAVLHSYALLVCRLHR